jgi:hypothetical protein
MQSAAGAVMEAMMHLLRILTRPLAAVVMLTALGAAAHADPIPQSALDADKKNCLGACAAQGKPADLCERYCTCSLKGVSEHVTYEEYTAVAQALSQRQNPPQATMEKLKAIAKSCMAQPQ